MSSYFKFKSVTFWSGLVLAVVPILGQLGIHIPHADVITSIAGGSGLIGLRKALGQA